MAIKLLSPVTLAATTIKGTDSGGAFTATVAAGTYVLSGYDVAGDDLLFAIKTALQAAGGTDSWNVTVSTAGIISIENVTNAWTINWTGTFDETILGVTNDGLTMAGDADATDAISAQHKYGWYSSGTVPIDTKETKQATASQSRSNAGTYHNVLRGSLRGVRLVSVDGEQRKKAYDVSGSDNESWADSFWPTANAGQNIRLYPDVTYPAAYYDCVLALEACENSAPARHSRGVELYSWDIPLRAKV